MKNFNIIITMIFVSLAMLSCQDEELTAINTVSLQNQESISPNGLANRPPRELVWADGILFKTIVTKAEFKPENDPFDILYAGNFKDGIGLISDAKPGDQDFNGGRWEMMVLKNGVDPNKYTDADSDDDLDPNDFEGNGHYFECPLLPMNRQ